MENTNYRETASFKEYEDIKKLLEQEKDKVKAFEVGKHIMRGVGWFAATVSILFVVGYAVLVYSNSRNSIWRSCKAQLRT